MNEKRCSDNVPLEVESAETLFLSIIVGVRRQTARLNKDKKSGIERSVNRHILLSDPEMRTRIIELVQKIYDCQ